MNTDDLILTILTNAANAIVARERMLATRARVCWTPALAAELADARYSRESFITGMPSDSADRRNLRAALIAAAEL